MLCMETDDIEGNGPFQVYSEVPSEPTSPEMLSNLTDEERCARISRILMKKDIAQSLLDTFNATTFGYALDEDDRVNVNLKRNASHITTVNDDNADGFANPPKKKKKKLTAKGNFTKVSHNTIETKNLYDKLNIDEQERGRRIP
ncbi:hypothetical protein CEXT_474611 [Caerostris extrusa]|uniref:Uncharacterized protein n=1 Tax=Caerostris extrusa TaxID=172846 RepID=A0AAV4W066_CAEEX|nr:hypothetical protein CEXT_474611 [Caerostris extrusa]